MNRRKFIKRSSSASSALLLSPLNPLVNQEQLPSLSKAKAGFELLIFATNWGYQGNIDSFCTKAKKEGYDGIEVWWPMEEAPQVELFAALKKHQLQVGFLVGAYQASYQENLLHFKKMADAAATNPSQKPVYINCHSGRDFYSYEQNKAFIDHTTRLSKQTGIKICHETHRARMLFAAPIAKPYVLNNPDLRITFDVSHWCNVSESLLSDQKETLDLVLGRVEHIHARVGYPQGPQVSDPRAPEWEKALQAHLAWWDVIAERKRKNGERMTVLTEFGPPDYMPTLPYTNQPLADQWAINVFMMQLFRKRYT